MDRLRQSIKETAMVLQQAVEGCDQFDAGALVLDTARSVLDAPRLWLCEVYWEVSAFGPRTACVASPTQHSKCRWVRLVDDPQGGGEDG